MWLIDTETFRLESFQGGSPRYAVLSHTWGSDEVTFADFHDQHNTTREKKAGYHKLKLTCEQARKDGIRYAWIDTCCINKESSAELSEAINSMFKWYRLATVCYAYLEDFPENEKGVDFSLLHGCKWFSRGWTLQELLAPRDLIFFVPHEESWRDIGRKDELSQVLEQITNIPGEILLKQKAIETISVAARMSWAARRQTTREEDMAYCLMGIFNVNMPLLHGEGEKAFIRLQEEIMRETRDDSLFAWCSTKEAAAEAPYRGLLARSPEEFLHGADIEYFDADEAGAGSTTSMLGQGRVSLSCCVHPRDNNRVILSLKCSRGDLSNIQGIECMRIGENYYLRSRPSQLFPCGLGSLTSVTIDKYALKTEDNKDDHVYRRDSIYLGDLPDGLHFTAVHSERAGHYSRQKAPDNQLVPVQWAIGCKMAFEIEIEKYVSGDRTQSGWSVEDRRLLILFWVDTFPESRSYRYHSSFSLEKSSSQDAAIRFKNAIRPPQSYNMGELTIGRVDICVRHSHRKVEGQEVLYFHVSTETTKKGKGMIRAESSYTTSEAGMARQPHIGVASSSDQDHVGPPRQTELHSRSQTREEAGSEHLKRHNNLKRYRLMLFLKTGLCIIASLVFFTFLSGDLKLAFLITSFLAVMLVIPVLAGAGPESPERSPDEESPLL